MDFNESFLLLVLTLDSTARLAVPLLFCALAGLFAERSGVIDIGLEGKMLAAAFAAAATAAVSGSNGLGLGAGVLIAIALAALHGFACITHKGSQVV
ncbi:MAG: ABC transporter permease, partial [Gammaproteobacteria bacterium]|nr:ABC transporter permease [Gammaproteobacteria bacterium]